jgi:uncharacterized protein (TIGR02391 family)
MELHPTLASSVRLQFLMGEFELAAFAALREVEIRVRELGGFSQDKFGVALMAAAFHPQSGSLADPDAESGEREALMGLFRGAIGTFKNASRTAPSTTTTRRSRPRSCFSRTCSCGSLTGSRRGWRDDGAERRRGLDFSLVPGTTRDRAGRGFRQRRSDVAALRPCGSGSPSRQRFSAAARGATGEAALWRDAVCIPPVGIAMRRSHCTNGTRA